ncbi:MAG: acetyltransferase, partial [Actinomycetota bacterium]|nr:acetyltransferase [Actinomycetota bacterium]
RTLGVAVAVAAVGSALVVARPSTTPSAFLALEAAAAAPPSPTIDTLPTTTTTTTPSSTTTTVDPLTTTSTTAVPTTLAPTTTVLPKVHVTGLGDSVLLEAKAQLERRLPDAAIDAEVGRQFKELLAVARSMRDSGALGPRVILQLGNNGPVTSSQFDDMMEVLEGRRVVVVNVKVARPWEGPNNAVLAEGVARWPNAVLVDWHKQGAAHPELFADDGTHMGPTGVAMLVEMILANL